MNALMDGLNQAAAIGLAALLNTLWYAAAVVVLTWVVLRYSQRVNAATRYWIWTAVLGFILVLPFLPGAVAQAQTTQAPQARVAHGTVTPQAFRKLLRTAKFEVASIRPLKPGGHTRLLNVWTRPYSPWFRDGGFNLRMLLVGAFDIQDAQIVGGPSWIRSERFDVQAKASPSVAAKMRNLSPAQVRLLKDHMLRHLLVERFGLRFHWEKKLLPVYVLTVAKHGPKLVEVQSPGWPTPGHAMHKSKKRKANQVEPPPGSAEIFAGFMSTSLLASYLSADVHRPVLDRTGLKGHYRFNLFWMPSPGTMGMFGPRGTFHNSLMAKTPQPLGASGPSGPTIFSALKEQLGLELKRGKGKVKILVIDQIEQPTPN